MVDTINLDLIQTLANMQQSVLLIYIAVHGELQPHLPRTFLRNPVPRIRVPRVPPALRELLLLQGMFVASLLPLYLLHISQSSYASYTLGELPLVLLFGNMLLVLRFRLALLFTKGLVWSADATPFRLKAG